MKPFKTESGIVAILDRDNVDTDAIMPKQFMKSVNKNGLGQFLFDEWRYLDQGYLGIDCQHRPLNPDFELNLPQYKNASILITRSNFGCGSSREHAPWALAEYGFKVIIAESFANIFYSNCIKNGMLLIVLNKEVINELCEEIRLKQKMEITVDLENMIIITLSKTIGFNIDPSVKHTLIHGLDDIEKTLEYADKIIKFEEKRFIDYPWII